MVRRTGSPFWVTERACVWAPDGEKAADLMDNEKFDLLLLDVMLPGINGYELMEYAKTLELPVIFLTALGSTENKVKGLKMGADDYLAKPFAIPEQSYPRLSLQVPQHYALFLYTDCITIFPA